MSGRLSGKKTLITAAAQGIGRATVEAFAAEGAHVIATDVNAEKLAEIAGIDGVETRILDVLDSDAVKAAGAEIGAVDALFNCAGFVHHGTILECDEDAWDFSFDLNVKAQYRMIRAFLPAMLEAGGGSIINMSSQMGHIGSPNRTLYCTTKHAVEGLTKALGVELAPQGIRVNAVAPTFIDTPMTRPMFENAEFKATVENNIALGHVGKVEDVAAAVLFLASPAAAMITGESLKVDGGWTAW